MAIKSFRCKDTQALFGRNRVRRFSSIETVARRKLEQLDWAGSLDDLRVPPGNRLEALRGDRKGQYSIRINDQFRVCFRWKGTEASDVRSEEHTSELQSLMRISYAVFCLKKKKNKTQQQ